MQRAWTFEPDESFCFVCSKLCTDNAPKGIFIIACEVKHEIIVMSEWNKVVGLRLRGTIFRSVLNPYGVFSYSSILYIFNRSFIWDFKFPTQSLEYVIRSDFQISYLDLKIQCILLKAIMHEHEEHIKVCTFKISNILNTKENIEISICIYTNAFCHKGKQAAMQYKNVIGWLSCRRRNGYVTK